MMTPICIADLGKIGIYFLLEIKVFFSGCSFQDEWSKLSWGGDEVSGVT